MYIYNIINIFTLKMNRNIVKKIKICKHFCSEFLNKYIYME